LPPELRERRYELQSASRTTGSEPTSRDLVDQAAERLYDAECALHIAHQTRTDPWITAAADQLHHAVLDLTEAERGHKAPRQPS